MATTRESIDDAIRWVGRTLWAGARYAAVLGVAVGVFAVVVVVTTRDQVSDCSDVSDAQRDAISALASPDAARSFVARDDGRCVDGEFGADLEEIDGPMEAATAQLAADGWNLETDYIAFALQLWRRCFTLDAAGWEGVQISVDADRGGAVDSVRAIAPENAAACELERREESRIYPPSDDR